MNNETLQVLTTAIEACDGSLDDYTFEELMQVCIDLNEELENDGEDYTLDMPYGEVRIMAKSTIDALWTESLIEQIKECYDLDNMPSFIEIDWAATAGNCKVDGLGHHFSSYDGNEYETENYYIFRTN